MSSDLERTDRLHSCRLFDMAAMPIGTMLLLFTAAAAFEARNLSSLTALSNGDIWWHLRTGIWMVQNHCLPHSGLFSQSAELPWIASSWGFDLLVASGFRMLGLRSVPFLLIGFKSALAVVTFLLAGGLRGRFWAAALLSAAAQYILGTVQAGPGYCSIVLFAAELLLLNESRRRGVRFLFWVPPLLLVWANLDIQFVFGMLLLVVFLAASLLQMRIPPRTAGIVALLGGIATLMTPYYYRLYAVFWAGVTSAANRYLPEFRAMGFRQPQDYVLMLLTMAAFLALGIRRSRDPFQIALMIGCTMLSFHAQGDAWLVALAAIAVMGEAVGVGAGTSDADNGRLRNRQVMGAMGLSVAVVTLIAVVGTPRSQDTLLAKVAQTYPVGACNFIREHDRESPLPRPLFNSYEWGGFLTWYLPEYPVAIDGRAGLYANDFVVQYFKAMNADVAYQSYPAMANAGTLLLQRNSLMGQALSTLPAFRVAYSDNVAVVLTRP
jgi:hypothetical protein